MFLDGPTMAFHGHLGRIVPPEEAIRKAVDVWNHRESDERREERQGILYAANLSTQVTVSNLCCMGIITEEQLAGWKLKPCIQPVRPSGGGEPSADQEKSRAPKGKVLDFEQMAIKVHREQ